MKIKIQLFNDYKIPNELVKGIETPNLWITEADDLYTQILDLINSQIKELKNGKTKK